MRIDITTRLNSSDPGRDGELEIKPLEGPLVAVGDSSPFASLQSLSSVTADACVYCGAKGHRTTEHVIPYGWSGSLKIYEGSCEACQMKTKKIRRSDAKAGSNGARQDDAGHQVLFEAQRGAQSDRCDPHQGRSTCDRNDLHDLRTACPGVSVVLSSRIAFGGGGQKQLNLIGTAATVFGPDTDQFLKEHGAAKIIAKEEKVNPTAFARTMAKIAYCFAWVDGVLEFVDGHTDLVHAFMDEPELLGTFVGTKPAPSQQYEGMEFRVQYLADDHRLPIMEVQPFSDAPAPTYLVVLGKYRDHRARRQFRARLSERYLKKNNTPAILIAL